MVRRKKAGISVKPVSITIIKADGRVKKLKLPLYHQGTTFQRNGYIVTRTEVGDRILLLGKLYERVRGGFKEVSRY